jgi:hypothetical protein
MELMFWVIAMAALCFALCLGSGICNVIMWIADLRRARRPMARYRRRVG